VTDSNSGRPLAPVVVVAFFPTGKPGDKIPTTPLQDLIGEVWVQRIHYAAAFVFIFLLSRISHYWAKHRPERRRLHKACEWVILAALVLAALEGITDWPDYGILIAEFANGFEHSGNRFHAAGIAKHWFKDDRGNFSFELRHASAQMLWIIPARNDKLLQHFGNNALTRM